MRNFDSIIEQLQFDGHYKMAEALKTHMGCIRQLQVSLEENIDRDDIICRAAEVCANEEEISSE